jgi:EAL domain-containing protein (putative c-di-GMP-specific phosphodiesterase class I)
MTQTLPHSKPIPATQPCRPRGCACQSVETQPRESGRLFLWLAAPHMRAKLLRAADTLGWTRVEGMDGADLCLDIPAERGGVEAFRTLCEDFTSIERADTRILLLDAGATPGLGDMQAIRSLDHLIGSLEGGWLGEIIEGGRLKTQFQPIVEAADPRRVFAHECLLRGVDPEGAPINPGRMFETARAAGMLFALDGAARVTAVETAHAAAVDSNIFINFTPTSIYDPANCLRTTLKAIDSTTLNREKFVFEVVESERIDDVGHLANVLDQYRENGFRVALDDVGAGYSSLNLLPVLKPDFVKIDMELVQGVNEDPVKAAVVERLVDLAHDIGARIIAEGIETKDELYWLISKGVDLLQGFYLARPADAPLKSLERRTGAA